MDKLILTFVLLASILACSGSGDSPASANKANDSSFRLSASLTGMPSHLGYLTLHNGSETIKVSSQKSGHFEKVYLAGDSFSLSYELDTDWDPFESYDDGLRYKVDNIPIPYECVADKTSGEFSNANIHINIQCEFVCSDSEPKVEDLSIPDPDFNTCIQQEAYCPSVADLKILDCDGYNVNDISGIEQLSALEMFNISWPAFSDSGDDGLNTLDFSGNPKLRVVKSTNAYDVDEVIFAESNDLEYIELTATELEGIDVGASPKLRYLEISCGWIPEYLESPFGTKECDHSQSRSIDELDVSQNPELEFLMVTGNSGDITELDLSNNPKLRILAVSVDSTELDLSYNPLLEVVDIYGFLGTTINLNNPKLRYFWLSGSEITHLDFTSSADLETVIIGYGKIESVDFSNNFKLRRLEIAAYNNYGLTSIDVSDLPLLTKLSLYNQRLTSIDLSNNPLISYLNLTSNHLTSLDVSNLSNLESLYVNNSCSREYVSTGPDNYYMKIESNLAFIDLSQNTKLKTLNLEGNVNLSSLSLINNPQLDYVRLRALSLDSIDLSANTEIGYLDLGNCGPDIGSTSISSLDLSNNTKLWRFQAEFMDMTSLILPTIDTSANIYIWNNPLSDETKAYLDDYEANTSTNVYY